MSGLEFTNSSDSEMAIVDAFRVVLNCDVLCYVMLCYSVLCCTQDGLRDNFDIRLLAFLTLTRLCALATGSAAAAPGAGVAAGTMAGTGTGTSDTSGMGVSAACSNPAAVALQLALERIVDALKLTLTYKVLGTLHYITQVHDVYY